MKKFLLFLIFPFITNAQISPGDLSSFHSHLEGISNCTKCHEIGEQVSNNKCLSCHKDISNTIKNNIGYHSSSDVKSRNCSLCHNEHHGKNFKIINFNKNKFNHSKTKFELTGKHSKLNCEECHRSKFISNPDLKRKKNTYLGIGRSCINCHEDYHQRTLSSNCESCHTTNGFKPSTFDHNKAAFKLTGSHQKVNCIECHYKEKRGGKVLQKFKGIAFGSCINCHKDVHNNKFGNKCENCHQTTSFKAVSTTNFDHNKTNFKLIGKHNSVSCKACHKNDLNSKPLFNKCTYCHEDYHRGELVSSNNVIRECNECHSESGFERTNYTIQKHNDTDFKLMGSHLAVPCNSCHYKENKWSFRFNSLECESCHKDIHGNELKESFVKCSNCHNIEKWSIVNFDHNKTGFKLLGKHSKVSCNKCHIKNKDNQKKFIFASLNSNCENCHDDIHLGQFNETGNSLCQRCHSFNDWRAINFDHSKTRFLLQGAHSKIECKVCHKTDIKNGKTFVKYKIEKIKCSDCHS